MTDADDALLALLRALATARYHFVTPTPATHARILDRRAGESANDLRDALGWSLPFAHGQFPEVETLLARADMLERDGDRLNAKLRVSSVDELLFLHSAYPTDDEHAVFLGPDSYRFARMIRQQLAAHPLNEGAHIVDIGTGAGVGALVAACASPHARLTLTDVNPLALRFARINAAAAVTAVTTVEGSGLAGVEGAVDLAIANPPYIIDAAGRAYRDGGGLYGGQAALDMGREAMARLAPGGTLLLYTGAAIVGGENPLCAALGKEAETAGCCFVCEEIDPDVFGEELSEPAYAEVERIAVVGVTASKR